MEVTYHMGLNSKRERERKWTEKEKKMNAHSGQL